MHRESFEPLRVWYEEDTFTGDLSIVLNHLRNPEKFRKEELGFCVVAIFPHSISINFPDIVKTLPILAICGPDKEPHIFPNPTYTGTILAVRTPDEMCHALEMAHQIINRNGNIPSF